MWLGKTQPDPHQQNAISVDTNSVVRAGAGSGKTTVLANRYLRLVREGKAGVENILTLTFTRKAAREMRERIFNLLLDSKGESNVGNQIGMFDRSQISTLDSFCSSIARNWAQGFGVPPDFGVDEEAAVEDAERIALEVILEYAHDPSLGEFIYVNGFEQVWHDFFVQLSRSTLTVADELDFDDMRASQEQFLASELVKKTQELDDYIRLCRDYDPGAGKAVANFLAAVEALEKVAECVSSQRFEELESLLSTFKVVKPREGKHPDVAAIREIIEPLKSLVETIAGLLSALLSKDVLKGMFDICAEFQQRVVDSRKKTGCLMYHDVVHMARRCLLENHELRRYYKNRYTHIMIDEFQDNNRLQKELLYLLAEGTDSDSDGIPDVSELDPGKLFFVGDEKQSIYMFRGADVSVFKELADELESQGGTALSLPKNYRTEPGLIGFFNTVFSRLMAEANEPFEARFEALEYREPQLTGIPEITILFKPDRPDSSFAPNVDSEALAVALFIKESVENRKLEVCENGLARPAEYGDFALLMRSTSNQNNFERAFRRNDIPYRVDSIRSLFLEAPVNDIYNLLQLTVYPGDRAALAAYLRSPFVHISDEAFIKVMLVEDGQFPSESVLTLEVPEVDRVKLEAGIAIYNDIRERADLDSLTELIFRIWYHHGYRYTILRDPEYHPYLEYYDYLRELARRGDSAGMSLAGFLDLLRPELGKFQRLPDLEVLREDKSQGVQILTVHRSKGLEFPIVILADAGNRGRSDEAANPYYFSNDHGITFNVARAGGGKKRRVNYFYEHGKEEQKKKDEAEAKRLLYVALTRAKYHLVVSGCHNRGNSSNTTVPLNMVLMSLGWVPGTEVAACDSIKPYLRLIPDVPQTALFADTDRAIPTRLSPLEIARQYRDAPGPPEPAVKPEWSASGLESMLTHERPTVRELPGLECDSVIESNQLEAAFGTLCHRAIERRLSSDIRPLKIPEALIEQLAEDELDGVVRVAEELAGGFLSSSAASVIDGAVSVQSEVPFLFAYTHDGREATVSGVIDLLVDRGDEVVILDFKTDRVVREGEYGLQLLLYQKAAADFSGKKVKSSLVYLRGNHIVEISDGPIPDLFGIA